MGEVVVKGIKFGFKDTLGNHCQPIVSINPLFSLRKIKSCTKAKRNYVA